MSYHVHPMLLVYGLDKHLEVHHPEMVIYDYLNNSMVPRLQIRNNGSKNEIAVI
ncbi:hypothetical protein PA3_38150 [Acinetobacter pittii]|uniref:Uncharacterized protein n=1 Tax=Acinetobacter pittii TaxID=48296 RepID=A0A4Y3JDD9_ACIPI|nr:hypothetical protein PA3_38150 [Acinetobacter pittii]